MSISKDFPDSFHRVTIKGLCVREGKVLMVRESSALSGKWELPGGGLDFGEEISAGFKREVQEEMGLIVSKMSKNPVYVWTHKYENRRDLEWFYSFVVAYRVEFEDLHFTASDECEAIEFVSKDDFERMTLSGQMKHFATIFNPEDFVEAF
jgi:8-oxo-dGTP pyrophosphatase MutT (NUDIX family)